MGLAKKSGLLQRYKTVWVFIHGLNEYVLQVKFDPFFSSRCHVMLSRSENKENASFMEKDKINSQQEKEKTHSCVTYQILNNDFLGE